MGSAAGKEFQEKELVSISLHEDGKNAFGSAVVTTDAVVLNGKTAFGAKPGYQYADDSKKVLFKTEAEGTMGRKGEIQDGDGLVLATVQIDHKRKEGHQTYYKMEPVYDGQEAEKVDGKDLYVFAKIDTSRSGSDIHATYSVATGKDTWQALYKSKRVIANSFKALVETADEGEPKAVCKIYSKMGLPQLKLEAAAGVDLAAVILTGHSVAPNGDMISQLPGATFGL